MIAVGRVFDGGDLIYCNRTASGAKTVTPIEADALIIAVELTSEKAALLAWDVEARGLGRWGDVPGLMATGGKLGRVVSAVKPRLIRARPFLTGNETPYLLAGFPGIRFPM